MQQDAQEISDIQNNISNSPVIIIQNWFVRYILLQLRYINITGIIRRVKFSYFISSHKFHSLDFTKYKN